MATVSLREYGRQRGVSGEAVRKAIKAGRLIKSVSYNDKGWPLIDPAIADGEWGANTSIATSAQQHQYVKAVAAPVKREPAPAPEYVAAPMPEPAPLPDDAEALGASNPAETYNKARAIKEAYLARLTKLDLDQRSGLLVSAEGVKKEAFKIARQVRDGMLNLPDRISAELAAEMDQFVIHRRLTEEIRRLLETAMDTDNE